MLGSAFAGTEEAPGEVVHKSVLLPESQKTVKVPFKVLRGMASLEAIRDRLDVEDADKVELEAIGAEGMEISVPARGWIWVRIADTEPVAGARRGPTRVPPAGKRAASARQRTAQH